MEKLVHLIFLVFLSASCAAENVTVVYGMEGGTISVNCTYNPWQQRWREKSWCKQIDETKCQHVVSARRFWLPFLKNRNGTTSISDNVRDGVLTVTMKQLKKQDAGLYQCKTDYLGETNSLRKVQVEVLTAVLETQMPEEPSAVQSISRTLYALMVPSSFLPTTALIATVLLLLTTYIRRKRAGKQMDFGRHPSFRQAALQKDGRNKASRMPEGEPNDCTIYAVIRHQPQPEDVIYVNTQPSPKVFFSIQEPPSNPLSSGPMEYATVIFRVTNPHSGSEKRKTGPPKQNSTRPWAYSQNFAELHLETIYS